MVMEITVVRWMHEAAINVLTHNIVLVGESLGVESIVHSIGNTIVDQSSTDSNTPSHIEVSLNFHVVGMRWNKSVTRSPGVTNESSSLLLSDRIVVQVQPRVAVLTIFAANIQSVGILGHVVLSFLQCVVGEMLCLIMGDVVVVC